ncbi:MAG: hypothetical protein ABI832_10570 [bacterium]
MKDNDEEEVEAILAVMCHSEIPFDDIVAFVIRQTKTLPSIEAVPVRLKAVVLRRAQLAPTWSNCLAYIMSEDFEGDALIAFLCNDDVRAALLKTPIAQSKEAFPLRQFLINAEGLTDNVYREYVRALPIAFQKFPASLSASKRLVLIGEQRITFNAENLNALAGEIDLQVEFVAKNITSYLSDPNSFSIDDDFRQRLLATGISDSDKRALIDSMDLSVLPGLPERASVVGPILLLANAQMPSLSPEVAKAIILNAETVGTQVKLLNRLHDLLNVNEVREVLAQFPDPYSKIQTGYARPVLKRTNENSELAKWLDERGIISSLGKPLWSNDIMINLFRS